MFEQAEYQHPQLEPYCGGSWKEVTFSWVLALIAMAAVLASL